MTIKLIKKFDGSIIDQANSVCGRCYLKKILKMSGQASLHKDNCPHNVHYSMTAQGLLSN